MMTNPSRIHCPSLGNKPILVATVFIFLFFSFCGYLYLSNNWFFVGMNLTEQTASSIYTSRIAVCLVGGARRFELTGPSILDRLLRVYPNADLFVHSPLDKNSYKLFLFNDAPKIAAVKIFKPESIPETSAVHRVLDPVGSPNGIQGLLQYFNLVEGCLPLINAHQAKHNFIYDWIIRTRVDGYWSEKLGTEIFNPGKYTVPVGSHYGGLNDRFGIGDYNTSVIALSRLSLIPQMDAANMTGLNSEAALKAQLTIHNVQFTTTDVPFCIVTDRHLPIPPPEIRDWAPTAAMSSHGPLGGAYCRPCNLTCKGSCLAPLLSPMNKQWAWIKWEEIDIELCNTTWSRGWENGWEKLFDDAAGEKYAGIRKMIASLDIDRCVNELEKMRRRTAHWDVPEVQDICQMGLGLGGSL